MNATRSKESWAFGISLFFIAMTINGLRYHYRQGEAAPSAVLTRPVPPTLQSGSHPQPDLQMKTAAAQEAADRAKVERLSAEAKARQDEADRRAAAEAKALAEAAQKHADELARYLGDRISRKPGVKTLAIIVGTDEGKLNRAIGNVLAQRFRSDTVEIDPGLFTTEFVADGLFADTFAGSRKVFARLDLTNALDALVMARETVDYSQTPSLENVITASVKLDVKTLPVAGHNDGQEWTFLANGPGFKREDALKMAEERIIKQISTNTNISLDAIFPNNR